MEQDWYKERNKRTDSFDEVTENCHNINVKVIVTANSEHYTTQVMVKILLNMLARWCSTISFTCKEAPDLLVSNKNTTLIATLNKMLLEIDPHGDFKFNQPDDKKYDICVFIGKPAEKTELPFIAIDGHGWVSSCAFNAFGECDKSTVSDNPTGASFAACLANAELFRWANNIRCSAYSKWYSLFDMSVEDSQIICVEELPKIDLGRVHIVGCGAIGSSFAYLLNLCDFTGVLTFVDADKGVELHNTSSSLLFDTNTLANKKTKAQICIEHLSTKKFLLSTPFNGDYNQFGYAHDKQQKSADIILCFANDYNIWSTIQHLYPPVVFHATTSRSWGINVGRHIPLKDNCIMCTFKNFVSAIYVPKCAEVDMPNSPGALEKDEEREPHPSILPFLSPAAAIITLAEIIKFFTRDIPRENTTQFNMSVPDGNFIIDQQKSQDCDICKHQSSKIYASLGVKTNY